MKTHKNRQFKTALKSLNLALGIALCCSSMAVIASENVPSPAQQRPILFKGATLHTVSHQTLVNTSLLIDKGRIVSIGSDAPVPENVQVIELAGKHIYPGFIAANTVLGLSEVQSVRATLDVAEAGAINPNARAIVAINPDSELITTARSNGVLVALSVPAAGQVGIIAGTSALVQMDGWTWEDMAVQAEVGLHIYLPFMRFNPELFPAPMEARLEELKKSTAQRLKTLEEAFEMAIAYRDARTNNAALPIDVRWEAMLPVLAGKRAVFMHAQDVAQIRYALQLAQRFQLKMILVGGADAALMANVLKDRGVPVIIAGVHKLPVRRGADYDSVYTLAAKLAQAGVQFCIARGGSEDDAPNERNLPYEAAVATAFGLDHDEALKAITLYPAKILGVEDRLGSLDVGKFANLLVTNGDPLETTTKLEQVYIQGRLIDTTTKQSRLTDKYRQKYLQKSATK